MYNVYTYIYKRQTYLTYCNVQFSNFRNRYTYIMITNIGEIIRLLSYYIIGCIIHTLEFIFIELM